MMITDIILLILITLDLIKKIQNKHRVGKVNFTLSKILFLLSI